MHVEGYHGAEGNINCNRRIGYFLRSIFLLITLVKRPPKQATLEVAWLTVVLDILNVTTVSSEYFWYNIHLLLEIHWVGLLNK